MSTLHPRYRNLTVSFVLNSAGTPADRQREGVAVEHILKMENYLHFVITFKLNMLSLSGKTGRAVCRMIFI